MQNVGRVRMYASISLNTYSECQLSRLWGLFIFRISLHQQVASSSTVLRLTATEKMPHHLRYYHRTCSPPIAKLSTICLLMGIPPPEQEDIA